MLLFVKKTVPTFETFQGFSIIVQRNTAVKRLRLCESCWVACLRAIRTKLFHSS